MNSRVPPESGTEVGHRSRGVTSVALFLQKLELFEFIWGSDSCDLSVWVTWNELFHLVSLGACGKFMSVPNAFPFPPESPLFTAVHFSFLSGNTSGGCVW